MEQSKLLLDAPTDAELPHILETSGSLGGPVLVVAGQLIDVRDTRLTVVRRRKGLIGWMATSEASEDTLQLVAIWVERQREGLGRALVNAAIAEARTFGQDWLSVETTDGNVSAQAFYEALGFVLVSRIQGGFRDVLRLKGLDPDAKVLGYNARPINDILRYSQKVGGS